MFTKNSKTEAIFEEAEQEISQIILAYKFALGILELVLGFGILFFDKQVLGFYIDLTYRDFFDTPHDLLVDFLQAVIPYILNHKVYIVSILIILGVIKIVSCIAYWTGRKWGGDVLVALLLFFAPFDLVKLATHFSIAESVYFILDIFIIFALTNFKPKRYFRLKYHQLRKIV